MIFSTYPNQHCLKTYTHSHVILVHYDRKQEGIISESKIPFSFKRLLLEGTSHYMT